MRQSAESDREPFCDPAYLVSSLQIPTGLPESAGLCILLLTLCMRARLHQRAHGGTEEIEI